ncbi:MAG TPA: type IV toxin-antitoxin system AbiEi family antitoxin [Micromonosporaceae bacterium]
MEPPLLEQAVHRLVEVGLDAEVTSGDLAADGVLVITVDGRRVPIGPVQVTRTIRPSTAAAAHAKVARSVGPRGVLVTEYASPAAADTLRALGQAFVDTAGNAYLNTDGIFVWVTGQAPPRDTADRRPGRPFQATGLRVLFALLCQPALLASPYRTIAHASRVSLGSVHEVVAELFAQGWLEGDDNRRRWAARPELLDEWTQAYLRFLRPKTLFGRFAATGPGVTPSTDLAPYDAWWGGEDAGALLTGYLRPQTHTIYADDLPRRFLVDHRLRKADAGEVEVRRRFWRFDAPLGDGPRTVPPLLAYADLIAIGDARTLETAEMIRRDHLAGLVQPS